MILQGNAARRANPLFNANRLKLGVFFANIGGGARPTLSEERTRLSWPSVIEIARMADRAGIEAFIPLATWSARTRDSDFTRYSYEPWTWAAGIAQATEHLCIFTTAQVPIFPPVVAAKLTATVDHISNGRFAINVVCGHAGRALEGLVGAPELDHDEWYAYADEWIEILDRLWSEPDNFDYAGRFFDLKSAGSYPKPLQQPRPPIMNAGNSDVGQRWAARHSDMMFTAAPTGDYSAIKAPISLGSRHCNATRNCPPACKACQPMSGRPNFAVLLRAVSTCRSWWGRRSSSQTSYSTYPGLESTG